MRRFQVVWMLLAGLTAHSAELTIDFADTPKGALPEGFQPLLAGEGRPGQWEVVREEVESALAPLNPRAPRTAVQPVLIQRDPDPTDERFPMLVYERETFGDFTLDARLRIVGGQKEQMGGIAFRLQDAGNFYVIRISALGKNLRFYKVVGGQRGRLIGPSLPIQTNVWYDLRIRCQGNEIACSLNGSLVMPPLQDASFGQGKIAFWTKSDSICQFAGAKVVYTPLIPLSATVVEAALEKYSRVVDLQLYTPGHEEDTIRVAASKQPDDVGKPGGKAEMGAIRRGETYFGKGKGTVTVVMPVRDRNGDPVAAARIEMKSFPGQTENNAIVRARPIVELMEDRIETSKDPFR